MVRVDKTRINDILIGEKPASVMLNKDGSVIWEKVDDSLLVAGSRAGNVTLEIVVPNWCNYIEYILIAGGGGGESGSGSDGQNGRPANGGEISTGSYDIPPHIDRSTTAVRVQVTAGTGGVGGQSGGGSGRHGGNGSNSTLFILHDDDLLYTHRVDGGLGGPASGRARGGMSGGTPAVSAPRYLHRAAEPGAEQNKRPLETRYGVGGGGGSGGIFNRYNPGGLGAPGAALIAFGGAPTPPVTMQINLGSGTQARDHLRAMLSARGLDYETVTHIPFNIALAGTGSTQNMFQNFYSLTKVPDLDTSNVTNMASMFYGCSSLKSVPDLDTSNVTNMGSMFQICSSLTTVPEMDTRKVTDMSYMFASCSSLTSVPDLHTSQVTRVDYMFRHCSALTDGNVRLIGKHPNVITSGMILNSGLTNQPFYNTAGNPIPE